VFVTKEAVLSEAAAICHLAMGHPERALRRQCEYRKYIGFLWQHWLFRRGVPRKLTGRIALAGNLETNENANREQPVVL